MKIGANLNVDFVRMYSNTSCNNRLGFADKQIPSLRFGKPQFCQQAELVSQIQISQSKDHIQLMHLLSLGVITGYMGVEHVLYDVQDTLVLSLD